MKLERRCNLETCPMFIGLFLEGQNMSGQLKEAINKKLLKWFKMGKELPHVLATNKSWIKGKK